MSHEIEARTLEPQPTVVMVGAPALAEIGPWLSSVYASIGTYLGRRSEAPSGRPFARFHQLSTDRYSIEAGFPVTRPVPGEGEIQPSMLPGGHVAVIVHHGPYDAVAPAYEALASWIAARRATPEGDPWEVYSSDPSIEADQSRWSTEIHQPYRPS